MRLDIGLLYAVVARLQSLAQYFMNRTIWEAGSGLDRIAEIKYRGPRVQEIINDA